MNVMTSMSASRYLFASTRAGYAMTARFGNDAADAQLMDECDGDLDIESEFTTQNIEIEFATDVDDSHEAAAVKDEDERRRKQRRHPQQKRQQPMARLLDIFA